MKAFVYIPDSVFEGVEGSVLTIDDFFPVPLVYKDRVDVVRVLIAPDCIHVRVNAFADCKTILFQGISLPFGKRLDNLRDAPVLFPDIKTDRALHAV